MPRRPVTTPEATVRATFTRSDVGEPWGDYMAPDFRMLGEMFGAISPPGGWNREAAQEMMASTPHRTRLLELEVAPDGRVFTRIALSRDASGMGRRTGQVVYALWTVRDGCVSALEYGEDAEALRRAAGLPVS